MGRPRVRFPVLRIILNTLQGFKRLAAYQIMGIFVNSIFVELVASFQLEGLILTGEVILPAVPGPPTVS